jgi:hypothetical protein
MLKRNLSYRPLLYTCAAPKGGPFKGQLKDGECTGKNRFGRMVSEVFGL